MLLVVARRGPIPDRGTWPLSTTQMEDRLRQASGLVRSQFCYMHCVYLKLLLTSCKLFLWNAYLVIFCFTRIENLLVKPKCQDGNFSQFKWCVFLICINCSIFVPCHFPDFDLDKENTFISRTSPLKSHQQVFSQRQIF